MSLRKAINEKCQDCIYDPYAPGNWRQQVEFCNTQSCPLYAVRPRSRSTARVDHYYPDLASDVRREGCSSEGRNEKAPAATEALKESPNMRKGNADDCNTDRVRTDECA